MNFNEEYFIKRGNLFPFAKGLFYSLLVKLAFWPRNLLDVGCAKGEFVRFTSWMGIDSYGIDISEAAINHVTPRLTKRLLVGDILTLPFPNKSFDLVTSLAVLEHISQKSSERAVSELLRASRKHVLVQICVSESFLERRKHYLLDPTHVNVQTSDWWMKKFDLWGVSYQELLPKMGVFVLKI